MPLPNNTNYADFPSKAEVDKENRRQLAEHGCAKCDEDDPDNLGRVTIPAPSCPAMQTPPKAPWKILCEDHKDTLDTPRERALNRARELNERPHDQRASTVKAVAFYECGNSEFVKKTAETHPHAVPNVSYRCKCGADIDEVVYLDE